MGLRFVLRANVATRNMVVYFAEFLFASAFTITIPCNYLQIKVPFILYESTYLTFDVVLMEY